MSQNVIECTEYAVNEKQNILKRKKIISKTYLNFYNCFQIIIQENYFTNKTTYHVDIFILPYCNLTYCSISNKGLFIGHHGINCHLLEIMNCNYSNGWV